MKALSIKTPYAYLICAGLKKIEYRSWNTDYRGQIAIHSSGDPMTMTALIDPKVVDNYGLEQFDVLCNGIADYKRLYESFESLAGTDEFDALMNEGHGFFINKDGMLDYFGNDPDEAIVKNVLARSRRNSDHRHDLLGKAVIGEAVIKDVEQRGKGDFLWHLENPVLYDRPIAPVKGRLRFWEFNRPE